LLCFFAETGKYHIGTICLVSVYGNIDSYEGVTIRDDEELLYTRELCLQNIIFKLAGKAATEMVFGVADQGCENDVRKAVDMVRRMADDLCCLGFDSYVFCDPSPYSMENRERQVAMEMEQCYRKAKEIIAQNRGKLDALTEALLKQKTLLSDDVAKIMAG